MVTRAVAHVAAQDGGVAPGPTPAARRGRRRPPHRRAAHPGARHARRGGLDRRGRWQGGEDAVVGAGGSPRRRRRNFDRRRDRRAIACSSSRPRPGVTRCDGVAGAPVPPRLRLRQRPLPPRHVAVARAGRREAGRAPGRSRDARRPPPGRVSLDCGVEHARLGQRRPLAGLARRAERRRRRHHLGRGHGRRRARRVRHRADDRRRLRRAGLRIFPGDGASLEAFRGKNRIRKFQIAFGPAREQRFDVEIPVDPAADAAHWRDPFWVPLPKPMPASCVTVVVTEVALGKDASPPKSFGTAAIGDLAVFTELDSPEGAERLVADLATRARLRRAAAAADRPGPGGVLPTAQAVMGARGYRARVPGRRADDAGAGAQEPLVLEALASAVAGASDKEERLVDRRRCARDGRAGLAAGGAAGVRQGARRRSGARGARAGRVDDARAAAALVDALGRGPVPLRAAVVSAIGRRRSCPAQPCWPRSPRVRMTAARARPTCCARCPR